MYQSIETVGRDSRAVSSQANDEYAEIKKYEELQNALHESRLTKEATYEISKQNSKQEMFKISSTQPNLKLYTNPTKRKDKFGKRREAAETHGEINAFETRQSKIDPFKHNQSGMSGDDYMRKIKLAGQEKRNAADERGRRRRKVLVDVIDDLFTGQNEERDRVLVSRVTRESILERRLATQLMSVKKEKEVLRENRIRLEREFEDQRLMLFNDALDREAENLRIKRDTEDEEATQAKAEYKMLQDQRLTEKKEKHKLFATGLVDQILDFALTVSQHNTITGKNIPIKSIREWRDLFARGEPMSGFSEQSSMMLTERDLEEYLLGIGEWQIPPEIQAGENRVLSHFENKIKDLYLSDGAKSKEDDSDKWPLRIAVLGKPHSNIEYLASQMAETHPLIILNFNIIVQESVDAFQSQETVVHQLTEPEATGKFEIIDKSHHSTPSLPSRIASAKTDTDHETSQLTAICDDENINTDSTHEVLSSRALLGEKVVTILSNGESIDDSLAVEIVAEAIGRVQPGAGWILLNFPKNMLQYRCVRFMLILNIFCFDIETTCRINRNVNNSLIFLNFSSAFCK